jgi:hypothetical protein
VHCCLALIIDLVNEGFHLLLVSQTKKVVNNFVWAVHACNVQRSIALKVSEIMEIQTHLLMEIYYREYVVALCCCCIMKKAVTILFIMMINISPVIN